MSYCLLFAVCNSVSGISSPVGTAHAYDIIHIQKSAIEAAGTTERTKVRAALERLDRYDGLVRVYDPPFTPARHDALDRTDFRLSRYTTTGAIMPLGAAATQ